MEMEDPDRGTYLTPEQATTFLKDLGYNDLEKVPIGRGNDRLSAYVEIASGKFPGVDLSTAIAVVRKRNNARDNTPNRP